MGVIHRNAPPPVPLLMVLSLVGNVSPRRASIPCHFSFVAGSEFGCANGVFWQCTRRFCEEMWHGCGAQNHPIVCTC